MIPTPPSLSPIVLVCICLTNPGRRQGVFITVKTVAVEGQGRRTAREGRGVGRQGRAGGWQGRVEQGRTGLREGRAGQDRGVVSTT